MNFSAVLTCYQHGLRAYVYLQPCFGGNYVGTGYDFAVAFWHYSRATDAPPTCQGREPLVSGGLGGHRRITAPARSTETPQLGGLLLVCLAVALVGGATGCGSSQSGPPTTTTSTNVYAGTYVVTSPERIPALATR